MWWSLYVSNWHIRETIELNTRKYCDFVSSMLWKHWRDSFCANANVTGLETTQSTVCCSWCSMCACIDNSVIELNWIECSIRFTLPATNRLSIRDVVLFAHHHHRYHYQSIMSCVHLWWFTYIVGQHSVECSLWHNQLAHRTPPNTSTKWPCRGVNLWRIGLIYLLCSNVRKSFSLTSRKASFCAFHSISIECCF